MAITAQASPNIVTTGFTSANDHELNSVGDTLISGNPVLNGNRGSTRILRYNAITNSWSFLGSAITSSVINDFFGWSVSVAGTGDRVAIGGIQVNNPGYVEIYDYNAGTNSWSLSDTLTETSSETWPQYGVSVKLSEDGNTLFVVSYQGLSGGSAGIYSYSFDNNTSTWSSKGAVILPATAAEAIDTQPETSRDGNRVIFSTDGGTNLYIYEFNGTTWNSISAFSASVDGEYAYVDMSANGLTISLSSDEASSAPTTRVYNWNGSSWIQRGATISDSCRGTLTSTLDRLFYKDTSVSPSVWHRVDYDFATDTWSSASVAIAFNTDDITPSTDGRIISNANAFTGTGAEDGTYIIFLDDTPVPSPTPTNTSTPTPTPTPTPTNTETPTPTPTNTETPTQTPSSSITPTPTNTETPTQTPTNTETPTQTPSSSITPTPTSAEVSTPTPTPTNTETPTQTPTNTSTLTQTPSTTSSPTPTPSQTPRCVELNPIPEEPCCPEPVLPDWQTSPNKHGSTTFGSVVHKYDDLAMRIKKMLGYPLIQLEVTNEQIYSAIDISMELFTKFGGFTEEYLIFHSSLYVRGKGLPIGDIVSITPELQNSLTACPSLSAAYDIDLDRRRKVVDVFSVTPGDNTGINTLFTIEQTIAQQAYFGHLLGNVGFDLITFDILKQWLETRERVLGLKPYIRFYPEAQLLRIIPEPSAGITPYYGIVGAYVQKPIRDLISNFWIYKYTLAQVKVMIAYVRGKYSGTTLFGGQTVSSTDLMQQGMTEMNELEKELKTDLVDREPIPFRIG